MTLSRKPPSAEKKIQEIIEKGGKSSAEVKYEAKKITVQLRLAGELLERIDESVDRRAVRIPRHTWFLEAIAEKLAREEKES